MHSQENTSPPLSFGSTAVNQIHAKCSYVRGKKHAYTFLQAYQPLLEHILYLTMFLIRSMNAFLAETQKFFPYTAICGKKRGVCIRHIAYQKYSTLGN
jgi:hypothetical protein